MKRGLAGGIVVLVLLVAFLGLASNPSSAAPVQACTDYPPTGCTTTSTSPGQVTTTTARSQVTSTTAAGQVTSTTRTAQVAANTDTKGKLPRTGSDVFGLLQVALLAIGLGAWTLYVRRRRVTRFAAK